MGPRAGTGAGLAAVAIWGMARPGAGGFSARRRRVMPVKVEPGTSKYALTWQPAMLRRVCCRPSVRVLIAALETL